MVEEEEVGGGATVSCVQFPVIIFCLMEFIQLAPLERNRCGGRQNKCAFFSPAAVFLIISERQKQENGINI